MSVYVDTMRANLGRMVMCHMVADTHEELVEMAARIGVQGKWIQKAGTPYEHFDVCLAKRAKAIAAGAEEISPRQLAGIMRRKREAVSSTSSGRTER